MPLRKKSNSCVDLISDMSFPLDWMFTVMLYARNMIMTCKIPCMNPLSSNLCLGNRYAFAEFVLMELSGAVGSVSC